MDIEFGALSGKLELKQTPKESKGSDPDEYWLLRFPICFAHDAGDPDAIKLCKLRSVLVENEPVLHLTDLAVYDEIKDDTKDFPIQFNQGEGITNNRVWFDLHLEREAFSHAGDKRRVPVDMWIDVQLSGTTSVTHRCRLILDLQRCRVVPKTGTVKRDQKSRYALLFNYGSFIAILVAFATWSVLAEEVHHNSHVLDYLRTKWATLGFGTALGFLGGRGAFRLVLQKGLDGIIQFVRYPEFYLGPNTARSFSRFSASVFLSIFLSGFVFLLMITRPVQLPPIPAGLGWEKDSVYYDGEARTRHPAGQRVFRHHLGRYAFVHPQAASSTGDAPVVLGSIQIKPRNSYSSAGLPSIKLPNWLSGYEDLELTKFVIRGGEGMRNIDCASVDVTHLLSSTCLTSEEQEQFDRILRERAMSTLSNGTYPISLPLSQLRPSDVFDAISGFHGHIQGEQRERKLAGDWKTDSFARPLLNRGDLLEQRIRNSSSDRGEPLSMTSTTLHRGIENILALVSDWGSAEQVIRFVVEADALLNTYESRRFPHSASFDSMHTAVLDKYTTFADAYPIGSERSPGNRAYQAWWYLLLRVAAVTDDGDFDSKVHDAISASIATRTADDDVGRPEPLWGRMYLIACLEARNLGLKYANDNVPFRHVYFREAWLRSVKMRSGGSSEGENVLEHYDHLSKLSAIRTASGVNDEGRQLLESLVSTLQEV